MRLALPDFKIKTSKKNEELILKFRLGQKINWIDWSHQKWTPIPHTEGNLEYEKWGKERLFSKWCWTVG